MAKQSKKSSLLIISFLLFAILTIKGISSVYKLFKHENLVPTKTIETNKRSLWRSHKLVYTKHARCRMECREISDAEVESLQHTGVVNYSKSDLQDRPCSTYAVEGKTPDGQDVRIIFGACEKITTVITCIDLDKDHTCNCP